MKNKKQKPESVIRLAMKIGANKVLTNLYKEISKQEGPILKVELMLLIGIVDDKTHWEIQNEN